MASDAELFGARIPFANHCDIVAIAGAEGRTELAIDLRAEHLNNLGVAHGGLIATLLDVAMGTAARTLIGRPVMTLDMNVSFLSTGSGKLKAEGRVVKAGRSIVFCEATVTGEDGETVARSSGTMKAARPTANEDER